MLIKTRIFDGDNGVEKMLRHFVDRNGGSLLGSLDIGDFSAVLIYDGGGLAIDGK